LEADPFYPDPTSLFVGLSQGTSWTLTGCWCTKSSDAGQEFYVETAFAGDIAIYEEPTASFDEVRVGFDGLWSMVPSSPRRARQFDQPPVSLTARVDSSRTVELVSEMVDLEPTAEDAFAFKDRLIFVGTVPTSTSFWELRGFFVWPLEALVTLGRQRGATVNFCEVSGPGTTGAAHGGEERRHRLAVYWNRIGNPDTDPEKSSVPALQLPTEPDRFQEFISNWFNHHTELALPIGLRTSDLVAPQTFSSTRFLLVAQALEALHRRLYPDLRNQPGIDARTAALANVDDEHRKVLKSLLQHAHEPTFRQRVKQLRDTAEPQITQIVGPRLKAAIAAIVETRNAVTHWDPSTSEPEGLRLVTLRAVADALFDVVLLKQLGLGDDDLHAVVRSHQAKHVRHFVDKEDFGQT